MSGVKVPLGVLGGTAVVSHVTGTLPFTGLPLELYAAGSALLVLTGIALRLFGRGRRVKQQQ